MAALKDLDSEVQHFDKLGPDERKAVVRALEQKVRAGEIALTDADLQLCRSSQWELQRILAYLIWQEGRVSSTAATLRSGLISEMELLKRMSFDEDCSRMPLYYAVRAYVERLKVDKDLISEAVDDVTLMGQIEADLSKHSIDRQGQVLPKIREASALLREIKDRNTNPTIGAAKIARMGTVVVGVLGLIGVIAGAVIDSCSKEREQSPGASANGTAQPGVAAALPSINKPSLSFRDFEVVRSEEITPDEPIKFRSRWTWNEILGQIVLEASGPRSFQGCALEARYAVDGKAFYDSPVFTYASEDIWLTTVKNNQLEQFRARRYNEDPRPSTIDIESGQRVVLFGFRKRSKEPLRTLLIRVSCADPALVTEWVEFRRGDADRWTAIALVREAPKTLADPQSSRDGQ